MVAVGLYMREANAMKNVKPTMDEPRDEPRGPIYSPRLLTRSQRTAADLIVSLSTDAGISPEFMLALAVTESSLNPQSVGDEWLSFGLFQLNSKFIHASREELLDARFNTEAALEKMRLLLRSYPGYTYGDYAEAWTLGGAGRFKKNRRNPRKWETMQKAIDDLSLTLTLTEKP